MRTRFTAFCVTTIVATGVLCMQLGEKTLAVLHQQTVSECLRGDWPADLEDGHRQFCEQYLSDSGN